MKKEEKKQNGLSHYQSFRNNLYALRFGWSISKSRFLHTAVTVAYSFVSWVFYSAIFNRYIVGAIEQQKPFLDILAFILITSSFFLVMEFYTHRVEQSIAPKTDTLFYQRLYSVIYKKAKNVELMCYEDSEFYSKYTMAIHEASERFISVMEISFKIIFGAVSAAYVFWVMFEIDHVAVLFIFSPLLAYFVFGMRYNKLLYQRFQKLVKSTRIKDYVNRVMYLAEYAKELRLTNVFRILKRDYNKAASDSIHIHKGFVGRLIIPGFAMTWFGNAVIYEGVALYGAYRTMVLHNMDLATLAVLTSIMVSGAHMIRHLAEDVRTSSENGVFIQNLRDFLEYQEKIPEDADGLMPDSQIRSIEFRDVSFAYRNAAPCIKHLSFTIEGGSTVALVGHNGAGKTTITKLLFRLYDPSDGMILVNGTDIRKYNVRAYRKLFAAAFQDYKIFAMSVLDNVLMANPAAGGRAEAEAALKKSGVYDRVAEMPHDINTILTREFDDEGAVLSGGQYQKIVVARAFAQNAPVCVFDEPSSALDPVAEYDLYQSIMEESVGKTMIFISHRLSSVQNATMVYMLEEGEIIERGTHQQLMEQDGEYARMYQMQAKNYLALDDKEVPA